MSFKDNAFKGLKAGWNLVPGSAKQAGGTFWCRQDASQLSVLYVNDNIPIVLDLDKGEAIDLSEDRGVKSVTIVAGKFHRG